MERISAALRYDVRQTYRKCVVLMLCQLFGACGVFFVRRSLRCCAVRNGTNRGARMSVEVFREQRSRDVGLAAVAVAPFLAVAVALALMATNRDRYNWLIREDGPVEWMTIAIYVVAAAAAAYTTRRLWSAGAGALVPLYALFSLGLLVIAGEEASWGQRQIGFDTPQAVREVNTKGEFNFHNASGFPVHLAFILVSLYGTLGRPLI